MDYETIEKDYPRTVGVKVPGSLRKNRPHAVPCCDKGWDNPLKKLLARIEGLNVLLSEHNVAVVVDTIKEKFGTLRVYFNVYRVEPLLCRILTWPFDKVVGLVFKVHPKYIRDKDGLHQNTKMGVFLTAVEETAIWIGECIRWFWRNGTRDAVNLSEWAEYIVDGYINEAEDECFEVCERCGCHTHDPEEDIKVYGSEDKIPDYARKSQRVETKGWITYICRECHEKELAKRKALEEGRKDETNEDS